ncbi:MAG: S8 family peptidase [bacterium]|nr:S8 family peptidase [bacterium]
MNLTAQRASFFYQANSVQTEIFYKQWQAYALQKPKIPLQFVTEKGSECAFDGFGFNGMPQFLCTCNNLDAAKTLGTEQLWSGGSLGLNLSGVGINKLGIWDGGTVRATHRELFGRVWVIDSTGAQSAHSTQVAGNMIAGGILANARGMSNQAQLRSWNFTNDNAEIIAAAPDLLLSNHSYASATAWQFIGNNWYWYGDSSLNTTRDWKFGYYDNRSRIWDSVLFQNPYYLIVKAAGNDRGSGVAANTTHYYWNGTAWALTNTTRDTVGPYDCISTFGNAKNILTIGAVNVIPNGFSGPASVSILSFSSWGPTDDGRIKPDLVGASGVIFTTTSTHDSAYANLGGTSMSAPNVTGSLLLLQQYYHQLKGKYMLGASLKALAIHTANRCKAGVGPDYECGWGLPNISKAALCLKDSVYNTLLETQINNLDSFGLDVYYTTGDTLRATLAYTDYAGITAAPAYNDTSLKLVNDLDMRLLNMSGNAVVFPFVLNPANPALPASTGDNKRDNVEQLYSTSLPTGRYKIVVKHKANLRLNLPQKFSLVVSGAPLYNPALPVTWLNLQGEQHAWNEVLINFACAQEINAKEFVVEYSTDAQNFVSVGTVASKSTNSFAVSRYAFIHQISLGTPVICYYRIKQIDLDGHFTYSQVIAVSVEIDWRINSITPNPFTANFNVSISASKSVQLYFELYNLLGQNKMSFTEGLNQDKIIPIDASTLESGVYILMISEIGSDRNYRKKLIKQ